MASPYYILVLCLIVHFYFPITFSVISDFLNPGVLVFVNVVAGISHLLYPVHGWMATGRCSSYQMIRLSLVLTIVASISLILTLVLKMTLPYLKVYNISMFIFCTVIVVGLGMFEANAIQFGMNQMLDASSDQLSSFIHWYFWCSQVGQLFNSLITVGSITVFINIKQFEFKSFSNLKCKIENIFFTLSLVASSIHFLITVLGYLLSKKLSRFEEIPSSSLKLIYKVLNYSYQHKYPERRSAFTYWENDIPSRIDLGKDKYGGPFTYEQVEDVKTFFRLLLLIMSLFGFYLLGDGPSNYIICNFGCPSNELLLLFVSNPQHIPLIVVFIGVPIFELWRKYLPQATPTMLTRIWIGLFISLLSQSLLMAYPILSQENQPVCSDFYEGSFIKKCLLNNIQTDGNMHTQMYFDQPSVQGSTTAIYLFLISLTLQGISYVLVFMTTVEFISAQSPNSTKGLLIGIWYSMLSIKYIIINNLDLYPSLLHSNPWSVYIGLKGLGITLSIALFSLVVRYYHYRERNEVVNEQNIIEKQYERELLLNGSQD